MMALGVAIGAVVTMLVAAPAHAASVATSSATQPTGGVMPTATAAHASGGITPDFVCDIDFCPSQCRLMVQPTPEGDGASVSAWAQIDCSPTPTYVQYSSDLTRDFIIKAQTDRTTLDQANIRWHDISSDCLGEGTWRETVVMTAHFQNSSPIQIKLAVASLPLFIKDCTSVF